MFELCMIHRELTQCDEREHIPQRVVKKMMARGFINIRSSRRVRMGEQEPSASG